MKTNQMIDAFERLNTEDSEFMLKAPLLVCILIAGADGNIDEKEIRQAISDEQENKASKSILAKYFEEVSNDFEDKLKILSQYYPYESTQRDPIIMEELATINR